jgi:hypothetical protein
MPGSARDEFVVGEKKLENRNGSVIITTHKWYRIEDLDRFDTILIEDNQRVLDALYEDNRRMWKRIRARLLNEPVEIYTPVQKKYESEPEMVKIATLPIDDAKRKFG